MATKAEKILPKKFLDELRSIIREHNKDAANGKQKRVGSMTQEKRQGVLEAGFADLFELGRKLESPRHFKHKHLLVLGQHWEKFGQSSDTIQNKIYIFRVFTNKWLGKHNEIKESKCYVSCPDSVKRDYIATHDKSWDGKGIDVDAKLNEIYALDRYVGIQLRLEDAFGMRCNEAIQFRPNVDAKGDFIHIIRGTKGGRPRVAYVETEYQRRVLDIAKCIPGSVNGDMRRPGQSLEQAWYRYQYILRKAGISRRGLGVTGHGLRVGKANREYEKQTGGVKSPVQGGKVEDLDQTTHQLASLRTAELMGHGRISSTPAYYGSHGHKMRQAPKGGRPNIDVRTPPDFKRDSEGREQKTEDPVTNAQEIDPAQKTDPKRLNWGWGFSAGIKVSVVKAKPGRKKKANQ